jgi:hypothetical protein
MKEYSDRLSHNTDLLMGLNPAVWNATLELMKFSAFFRFVKSYYPDIWNAFIQQLQNVIIKPPYATSTVILEGNNPDLVRLILNVN